MARALQSLTRPEALGARNAETYGHRAGGLQTAVGNRN